MCALKDDETTITTPASASLLGAFWVSVRRFPRLWIGLCCLWAWPWLFAHDLVFYPAISQVTSIVWWGWVATFLLLGILLIAFALRLRSTEGSWGSKPVVFAASCSMALSTVLFMGVANHVGIEGPLAGLWWLLLLLWPLTAAFGQAMLFTGWGRILGSIGARNAVFQGIAATVVGAVATWVMSFLPQPVIEVILVALPLASGFLLCKTRSPLGIDGADGGGYRKPPAVPWKLFGTTLVMGSAFGMLQSLALVGFFDGEAWSAVGVPSFLTAAVLLFASALRFRMDFNRMIYKIGFFAMALGFLLVFLGSSENLLGYAVLCTGYRYCDLLLWGLCAYLINRRGYNSPWVIGMCMGPLLLGRFCGFSVVTLLSLAQPAQGFLSEAVVMMAFVLLAAALFAESHNNLVEAWGIERFGGEDEDSRILELASVVVSEEYGLSPRESEILGYLGQGLTRKEVSAKLVLSEETVKTHMQHIYEKCGVHSRRDLLMLIEREASRLKAGNADDAPDEVV